MKTKGEIEAKMEYQGNTHCLLIRHEELTVRLSLTTEEIDKLLMTIIDYTRANKEFRKVEEK